MDTKNETAGTNADGEAGGGFKDVGDPVASGMPSPMASPTHDHGQATSSSPWHANGRLSRKST